MNIEIPPYALRVSEAVRYCGIDRTTLYAEMKAGQLLYLQRGKVRLIRVRDLQSWLDSFEASGRTNE